MPVFKTLAEIRAGRRFQGRTRAFPGGVPGRAMDPTGSCAEQRSSTARQAQMLPCYTWSSRATAALGGERHLRWELRLHWSRYLQDAATAAQEATERRASRQRTTTTRFFSRAVVHIPMAATPPISFYTF